MKSSKRFVYFALALSISTGFGFSTKPEVAQAKPQRHQEKLQRSETSPPAWAPAWGYRCKNGKNVERPDQRQCKKNERKQVGETNEQKQKKIPANTMPSSTQSSSTISQRA